MHGSNKLWMLQTGIRCDKIEVLKIKAILLTLRKSIGTIAPAPPPVRDGVWVKVRVSFRVGGNPRGKSPRVWLGFGLALVGVGGGGGAIALD